MDCTLRAGLPKKQCWGFQNVYCGSRIRIFHLGSRVKEIANPDPLERVLVFLTQTFVSKLSEI
jgi:hypothetical protein